jgi:hypothetical protein
VPENAEESILSGFVGPYDIWAAMHQLMVNTGLNLIKNNRENG